MKYYLKCKYQKGMWNDEKIATIKTCSEAHEYSFFTFDTELTFLDKENALIELLGMRKLDNSTVQVMAREEGNPRYFFVPLEDIVEKKD